MAKGKHIEAARAAAAEQSAHWWQYAQLAAREARAGHTPPAMPLHGIVLGHNEFAILQTEAMYARLWGGDGTYFRNSTFAFGNPAFVVGALAASAIGNAARKRAAQRNAQVTWREHQHVSVIVTNHRFLCHTHSQGWLSFYFNAVSEFYPDLHGWTVNLVFENAVPLQLSGPSTPALSLWSAIGILGPRWADDPRLAPLLG
ncbi:hypothetical protein [Rhodococcus qingshengii]|uniref:hypothetical protein n=1 Tax=Rhodococcus qingshengii TaxID=334542 RepID=UPI001C230DA0|nr:hypothetical protein [Rhodococcus qingshengii]QXC46173.1 hypothetical protein KSE96_30910 [Rhodococcus qingshengii]